MHRCNHVQKVLHSQLLHGSGDDSEGTAYWVFGGSERVLWGTRFLILKWPHPFPGNARHHRKACGMKRIRLPDIDRFLPGPAYGDGI